MPRGSKYVTCRSYQSFDAKLFQKEIDETSWDEIIETTDINLAVNIFQNTLMSIVDKHAPNTKLKMRDLHIIIIFFRWVDVFVGNLQQKN